ncbi:MAG: cbb3-type cytochrome c oxidase subunit I, partial [Cyanobacteria bacterium]|nr:cbb3-type cytochrome c oxidase subunit I [Cyanobacteriota bacterium]
MNALTTFWHGLYSDKPFSASRNFLISAIFWLVFGTTIGLTAGALMTWPDLIHGISQLSFGRLRPLHIHGVLIGWLSMGYVGCMFYLSTILSGRKS